MMWIKHTFVFFILFVVMLLSAHGQECDTIIESNDTSKVYYYMQSVDSLALGRLHGYNMELAGIQNYNEIYKLTPFFASLGNPGLFYKNLLFNPVAASGFDFGIHSFDAYIYNDRNTEFYQVTEPFSELVYVLGPEKEQMVQAKLDTKIFPLLTIGADFRYTFAPGKYLRQKADNKSLSITAQFFTKKRRYGVIGNINFNKVYVYENGGITADSIFEEKLETDRSVIPVNLSSATNLIKQSSFYINQFFNIQKEYKKINDSTYAKRNIHAGRLTHSFEWFKETQIYSDGNPTSGFYPNIYLDSASTLDSVYHFKISNRFMWSNLGYLDSTERKTFYIYGSIRHEYHELGGYTDRKYFNQLMPAAGIYWKIRNTFVIKGNAELVMGDYNGGDYKIDADFAYYPGKIEKKYGRIEIGLLFAKQKPGWFYQNYSGNNFRWDNDFVSTDMSVFSLFYHSARLKAGIEYMQLRNYIALDSLAIPMQADNEITVLKAILNKEFRINIVGIDAKLAYQMASNEDFIALPAFMGDIAIFVTLPLFKGATTIQPGVQVYYNTSYYADAYMPALRSFHSQGNKEIGDFVYADIFFNFRIKRARLFLKYSHFNSLFSPANYFMVPSYPMIDSGFRFGISWKFFD